MFAVAAQLIIFSTIGCAFPRSNGPDDIIWYPIEGFQNGYVSSQGEYFVTQQSDDWSGDKFDNTVGLSKSRRFFRSLPGDTRNNEFVTNTKDKDFGIRGEDLWDRPDIKRAAIADERIVFPEDTDVGETRGNDCRQNCPLSSEYNPVCGTDLKNYKNPGDLKCEQSCGKSVSFAHYGVCGRGIPGIFKPKPRQPRSSTGRSSDNLAWDERIHWRFKHL